MRFLINHRLIRNYLRDHSTHKLHLGCGRNSLDGWLNSDQHPKSNNILRLNVTRRFPFEDKLFSYMFSEHMIEHLTYAQGTQMLKECHRILKPNGRIRISTPDLSFLLGLYFDDRSDLQKQYIEWATKTHVKNAPYYDATFVINNFVRDWGHQFIYDEPSLRFALEKAGFSEIVRCEFNASEDVELQGLENEARMPPGFLALESLILEAIKK